MGLLMAVPENSEVSDLTEDFVQYWINLVGK